MKPMTLEWVEKAEADTPFPKTHDLEALLDPLVPSHPELTQMHQALAALTDYALAFRYPGERATPGMAADALRLVTRVRTTARALLRLHRAR